MKPHCLLVSLSLVCGPMSGMTVATSASAATPRERGRSRDAAPKQPASPSPAAPGKGGDEADSARAAPLTSYQIELQIQTREASIGVDRKRAIALLEEFLQKHGRSDATPEALYRLSALYWERSQQRFLDGMESWAAQVERCKRDPERCPNGPPAEPQLQLTDSQTLYERLIREYPRFRKLDTVRYLYGFSLRDQGRVEDAQAQFWAIINDHPNSSFIADAWVAVGDQRFYGTNDFRAALDAYRHVLEHPDSTAYPMALFKVAWCHWKLGDREAAILHFKQVLDQAGDVGQDAEGRKRLADLREEALEYLVQVLSEDEAKTAAEIHDFLASIGGAPYSRKVLIRLAEAYEAQTRYDKSVPTWEFLIALDPKHEQAAEFQLHVFTGIRGEAKFASALDALETLHVTYAPASIWGKQHPAAARESRDRARETLFEFSRSLHESAQLAERDTKTADKDRYALAARAYEAYLKHHPASPHAVEISYLAGDIYFFKLAQLEAAGDAYLRVGESAPVGKLHRDALLAAIGAYEQRLASAPHDEATAQGPELERQDSAVQAAAQQSAQAGASKPEKSNRRGKKNTPAKATTTTSVNDTVDDDASDPAEPSRDASQEPPSTPTYNRIERKFIRAVDLFVALFPKDDEIGSTVYRLGEFFYQRGDYDLAAQRFGKVVVDHPQSTHAGASGDRILECLDRAKDYDNIELWAQKLKQAPAFSPADEQARLDRIIVASLLKQGEVLAQRGYHARGASYYLRVADEYPKHEQAALALNNAGAALERAQRAEAATEVYKRLVREYPNAKEAAEATLVVARVYENIAHYDHAATHYDLLVQRYPNHQQHADSLYNAGILYQALGRDKEAVERFSQYARQYAAREDAIDVDLRVGRVHAEAGRHKQAVTAFEGFISRHPNSERTVEANTLLAKSLIALTRIKQAAKPLERATKQGRALKGAPRVFAAEARYLEGELIHRRFLAVKLDPKPARLKASLETKAKLLGDAKNVYIDVVSYGAPEWSTAALLRIGESYERFAASLREYPIPKGLSEAEEQAYTEQLDTFALAFEEQAIEAYRGGYAKAMELKIYNLYTRQIRQALGRLSKQEFPPIAEAGTELIAVEGSGRGGRPVRSLKR